MIPLVVDLDGTIIFSDVLHELSIKLLKKSPISFFCLPYQLIKGKANMKKWLSEKVDINVELLPYNEKLLTWLKYEKEAGRSLILCTATDVDIAKRVSDHLGIFDDVIASDGRVNLSGEEKSQLLKKKYGENEFDYVGNSNSDLEVWKYAREAVVVNASSGIIKKTYSRFSVRKVFPREKIGIRSWWNMLRVHQWLKNSLLLVPVFAAHHTFSFELFWLLLLAFFSFSFCASSVYIVNDLLDLDSDRLHPHKCNRPFASGAIPIWLGVLFAPLIFLVSALLGCSVSGDFLLVLLLYFTLTWAYSLWLKAVVLIDCIVLALLYTLRVVAGVVAINHVLTFWLLAFSVFLFLSLAFVKRYAELKAKSQNGGNVLHGRSYHADDLLSIYTMGIASGYLSVLVLSLYLNSEDIIKLYQYPELLWGAVIVLLYWISWIWLQSHRGQMRDDPLIFAITDKTSLLAGVTFALIMTFASTGW